MTIIFPNSQNNFASIISSKKSKFYDLMSTTKTRKIQKKLKDHDILGSCTMVIGEIVHEPGMIMAKKLMHKGRALRNRKTKKYSALVATVEQVNEAGNRLVTMQFSAKELPKMDGLFG